MTARWRASGPHAPLPKLVEPMLPEAGELPTDDEAWSYELKWDGIRAVSYLEDGKMRLTSRGRREITSSFPELSSLSALTTRGAVTDGEIVSLDPTGRPSFQALQPRLGSSDARRSLRLAESHPVSYIVFDLVYLDGEVLFDRPYEERRALLEELDPANAAHCELSERFEGPGEDVFRTSKEAGLEGVLAKKKSSRYLAGRRSASWTKVKHSRTQEVVVGGWTKGEGRRSGQIGALLLGLPEKGGLTYVGKVGTGFTEEILNDLARRLQPLSATKSPFTKELPRREAVNACFVRPTIVGEVSFSEWTHEDRLRHPSWRGVRLDKSPKEVVREP